MKRLIVFLFILFFAANANAYTVDQGWVRFGATAGATLTTGTPVAIADADGEAYAAEADQATRRPCIGIVGFLTGGNGEAIEIFTYGVVGGLTGLTEGGAMYLSDTAGEFTQSAPSWSQIVGYAISETEMIFNPAGYFDTSTLTALGVLTGETPLIFEGATVDAFETTIAVTDPTADHTITLPNDTGAVMLSTLATNEQDVANSVWGVSNGIRAEGATANDHELTITWEDPTADITMTISDDTGSFGYTPTGKTTSAGASLAIPITHAIVEKTTGGAETLTLANGNPGQILTITLATDGGDGTLTPATATGWATAVLAAVGDTVTVMYADDVTGWILISAYGLTAQPTITQ